MEGRRLQHVLRACLMLLFVGSKHKLTKVTVSLGAHLEVLCNHRQSALKDRLKNARDLALHLILQLVDNGREQAENLCIPAKRAQMSQK